MRRRYFIIDLKISPLYKGLFSIQKIQKVYFLFILYYQTLLLNIYKRAWNL